MLTRFLTRKEYEEKVKCNHNTFITLYKRGKPIPGVLRILVLGSLISVEVDSEYIKDRTFEELNKFKKFDDPPEVLYFDRSSPGYWAEDLFSNEEIAEMNIILSLKNASPFYRTLDGELIWIQKIKNRLVWHNS